MFLTTLALAAAGSPQDLTLGEQLPGIYTNEEQAYFEKDAGRTPPPWISLKIEKQDDKLIVTRTDAFGKAVAAPLKGYAATGVKRDSLTMGGCTRYFDRSDAGWVYSKLQNKKACLQDFQITSVEAGGLKLRFSDGTETKLKRARPVECWAAAKKTEPKADGSPDWLFVQKLSLHDQGGRVMIGGEDSGAEPLILRMRAVYWPKPSTNRPSMVLYVHKPDNPDRAVSYSWADINASRVGLNLRWMQASCTIKGAERASDVTSQNFRG
ncbi:hypothetical protein GCM10009096_31310 [Parasphingorhabdus litoris]|uniref:Uncharacterized protein n=1 Tax=Parasphingorhabdus litoris TaxID=394733 RepID=A0ABN1AXZ7_9SPHN|nr:hypothetical protein [Parasphingorhabdus litoris]